MTSAEDFIQAGLKTLDPARYLACLYLPDTIRHLAMTLYTFDAEIARIPDLVSEPMPGEIRIQWWRDLIKSDGNMGSGPMAEELLVQIVKHTLPRDVLDNYLEARIFDLYQDPMPDVNTYEGYLGETVSAFLHMLAVSSGLERSSELADACGHSGVAIGIAKNLSYCSYSRVKGQVYFPITELKNHGLTRESWLSADMSEAHEAVITDIHQLAGEHLQKAKTAIACLPKESRTIFLPLCFAQEQLKLIGKSSAKCLKEPVVLSPLKRQWLAFRGVSRL